MSFEAVDVYVKDTTPAHAPVALVLVKIFSQDGAVTYTQSQTDGLGHAGFLLDTANAYQMRLYKRYVSFTNPLRFQVLAAPAINTFDVAAQLVAPPVPTDVRLCTAYGFFRTVTGGAARRVQATFTSVFRPLLLDGAGVLTERVTVATDEEGYLQINLIRFGIYEVTLDLYQDFKCVITVPDAANVNLPDLLFPIVGSISFTPPGPYVVAMDEQIQIAPTLTVTDGTVVFGTAVDQVIWSSSNRDVLQVLPGGPLLTLRGVAPGTASIQVERWDKNVVHYPDVPIAGQPVLVVVTAGA